MFLQRCPSPWPSPGGRGKRRRPFWGISMSRFAVATVRTFSSACFDDTRRTLPPLPPGEGRGEGTVQGFNARIFSENPLSEGAPKNPLSVNGEGATSDTCFL